MDILNPLFDCIVYDRLLQNSNKKKNKKRQNPMTVIFHIETSYFFFSILLKNWEIFMYSYGEGEDEFDFVDGDEEEEDDDGEGQVAKLYEVCGGLGGGGAFIMC
jgi:hypothetical protein